MHRPIAVTTHYDREVNLLTSDAFVHPGFDPTLFQKGKYPPGIQYKAIWDTGANTSVITRRVVEECELKPISMTRVVTASGEHNCYIYLVNIILSNWVGVSFIQATGCKRLSDGADILIGMDFITTGDLAISNLNGKTTLSFRTPSLGRIDFAEELKRPRKYRGGKPISRNSKCPCGSGHKYRNCCMRK